MPTRTNRRTLTLAVLLTGLACPAFTMDGAKADEPASGPFRRAPYSPGAARRTVEFWEQRVVKSPSSFLDWRELAGAYLALQRESGDIADTVRAEKAARRSLELQDRGNHVARGRLARSLLGQHRFPEALEVARKSAESDPRGLLLVSDVELELGAYDAAERDLGRVPAEPENLNEKVLRAKVAEIRGHDRLSLRLLREAATLADELTDMPAETAAWFPVTLGHALIDRGRLEEGESSCRTALSIYPRDYRAMTGLAEAAAFRGDHDEVLAWTEKALTIAPQNPEALIIQFDALDAIGRREQAARCREALDRLVHSFPRIYDRHWILFCADHDSNLDEAYALAQSDLKLRKDVHAYDALAWAAFKKGFQKEAEAAIRTALALGSADAVLCHHAAQISRAGSDATLASRYLARARELNPYLVKLHHHAN